MNHKLLASSLDGIITGGVSIKDFAVAAKMDANTAKIVLEEFASNSIGSFDGKVMQFDEGDKLRATILAIQNGLEIDVAAQHLSWKDFEELAARILEMKDFVVKKNLILTKPRMEIDVIGVKFGVAVLIDCKHWKYYSHASLKKAVKKQIERTKNYVSRTKGVIAAPVILTLYQQKVDFIDRVPIVPIFQFDSFIEEFYGNIEELKVIK